MLPTASQRTHGRKSSLASYLPDRFPKAPCKRHLVLPLRFLYSAQSNGGFNICLLPLFCATTKQNHQPLSIPAEINPVPGPKSNRNSVNPRSPRPFAVETVATSMRSTVAKNPRLAPTSSFAIQLR